MGFHRPKAHFVRVSPNTYLDPRIAIERLKGQPLLAQHDEDRLLPDRSRLFPFRRVFFPCLQSRSIGRPRWHGIGGGCQDRLTIMPSTVDEHLVDPLHR